MTATLTLATWLEEQLASDEAVALAAEQESDGPWWVDGPAEVSGKFWVYSTGEKFAAESVAQHVALHDPAHVLAQIAAVREVLALCRWTEEHPEWGNDMEIAEAWEQADNTIRALAKPYADRPGYAEVAG